MLVALVPLLLRSAPAVAPSPDPPPLALRWSAPAPCPASDAVLAAIAELTGPARTDAPTIVVEADVSALPDRFALALALRIGDDASVRRIEAARCEDLARATALVVATMVDPVGLADRVGVVELAPPVEDVAVRMPAPIAAAPELARPAVVVPRPTPRPRPRASLRLDGLAGVGTLPRIDGGLALSAGIAVGRARVELGAMHLFAQSATHPARPDVGLRVRATVGVLRACGVPVAGPIELPLCAGVEIGALAARGEGPAVAGASVVRSPYAAAFGEAHVAWRIRPRFALWVGAQGLFGVVRPQFAVAGLAPFVRAGSAGVRAKFGVEVRLP